MLEDLKIRYLHISARQNKSTPYRLDNSFHKKLQPERKSSHLYKKKPSYHTRYEGFKLSRKEIEYKYSQNDSIYLSGLNLIQKKAFPS